MLADRRKILRSGYTTGACAAAAAKAAAELVMRNALCVNKNGNSALSLQPSAVVEIPFPDGSRVSFKVNDSGLRADGTAWASVIKDAGDDPDVTNGAEIVADVKFFDDAGKERNGETGSLLSFSPDHRITASPFLVIRGGKGVGVMTKPGLPVPVGEAAINPVPRKMITEAVIEAMAEQGAQGGDCPGFTGEAVESGLSPTSAIEITISVPDGEVLAGKTLNPRLGIAGGISILGTTGIVKPISSEAWTATITASMDVARATGCDEVVLSAGRVSEKAHMRKYSFPEEAYVMMGDYLEFSFLEAGKHGFRKIHLCAQWAKMLKIAMATPQTHVRHGAIDVKKSVDFLGSIGYASWPAGHEFNTAREILDIMQSTAGARIEGFLSKVCLAAKKYTEGIVSGPPVTTHLVSYDGDIIAGSE